MNEFMEEQSRLDQILAARQSHSDADIITPPKNTDRVVVNKNRKSQSDGSVSNVISFSDTTAKTKYTFSVTVSATGVDTQDNLLMYQAMVTQFLSNIHEKI